MRRTDAGQPENFADISKSDLLLYCIFFFSWEDITLLFRKAKISTYYLFIYFLHACSACMEGELLIINSRKNLILSYKILRQLNSTYLAFFPFHRNFIITIA